jgi:hypothetical protein
MNEKTLFAAPEAEVVRFPKQDIVTTSDGFTGPPELPEDDSLGEM